MGSKSHELSRVERLFLTADQVPAHLVEAFHKLDRAEAIMDQFPRVEMPLVHRFVPGMYIRERHLPGGSLITSKVHKTEHPFTISEGACSVYEGREGIVHICAPFTGITKPFTRRLIYTYSDVVWTTYHLNPDEIRDPDELEAMLVYEYENPLLKDKNTIEIEEGELV
jgi:hypothetical protein